MVKNWCFQTVVLENTLESSLDFKEIQPVNRKQNQPWMFIGRTDAKGDAPVLSLGLNGLDGCQYVVIIILVNVQSLVLEASSNWLLCLLTWLQWSLKAILPFGTTKCFEHSHFFFFLTSPSIFRSIFTNFFFFRKYLVLLLPKSWEIHCYKLVIF